LLNAIPLNDGYSLGRLSRYSDGPASSSIECPATTSPDDWRNGCRIGSQGRIIQHYTLGHGVCFQLRLSVQP
jgi:hypothetical protein